jgi:fatty-acid peroxygenase
MPRESAFDSTLALLRHPYDFIAERARRHGSDVFETRLLLRRAICMTGRDAAELICDPERFVRHDATPDRINKTLLGEGGVQSLDGEAHRVRKQMFMSLMTPENIARLTEVAETEWHLAAERWALAERVVLYDELRRLLTRAVCAWAAVPLPDDAVDRRTAQLSALFEHAGSIGLQHWRARIERRRAEAWAAYLVRRVRAGELDPPGHPALHSVAGHREADGRLLDERVAAVELLNVLRPTVAVAVFITCAAIAIAQHPGCRARLAAREPGYAERFVQEVRRFYPFFPSIAARVRRGFDWRGYHFPRGRRIILDLYGTDHDPRIWALPETFDPDRFEDRDGSPYTFIPQGPGDHYANHRCPGEWITIALMQQAVTFLAGDLRYEVPPQDLTINRSKLPPLPGSRFVMTSVAMR